ncbi:glycosyltransferase family 2 protein [Thauera sinica]|uniref:Glycosyltransferase family 2 protein n=1 Tax=Thauera sinica TaxID=2665146 RepID=A0ABW1AM31_9RHOO|nr:glycosyltransferase [Thauera sp. K11]ATE60921.1 glycosyl transferase [Thauera sp. K11]
MPARISIVMPCYNAAHHLPRSIGSVLAQSAGDWELIAVDDGSRDGTLACLRSLDEPRIRVISQTNQGVSAARNAGLSHCRGEFIAFLDADDTWAPDFLRTLLGALENTPDAVLAYCGWQNLGLSGLRGNPFVPPDYEAPRKTISLLESCRWPIHACLTRRTAIEAAGRFDPRLRIGEDYLLWMEVAAQGRILRVPEVLAYYHHHGGPQATQDKPRALLDTLKAKEIFLGRHPDLAAAIPRHELETLTWGAFIAGANALYWKGNIDAARPLYRKALLSGRGSAKDKLRMAPSLLPKFLHLGLARLLGQGMKEVQ